MLYILATMALIIIFYNLKNINLTNKENKDKLSIYECGFNEFDQPRQKYYIKFYIIAILFLIFDLETILLYPLSLYISALTSYNFFFVYYFFIILSIGLGIEIIKNLID